VLNSAVLRDALVSKIQAIPSVVQFMGGDPTRIFAHVYSPGNQDRIKRAVATEPAPHVIIAWTGIVAGPRDGSVLGVHRFELFCRLAATPPVTEYTYEDFWHALTNDVPVGDPVNIRYLSLIPEVEIMDTPFPVIMQDEDFQDYLQCTILIPELGDN
jgi:hypothetical protein